ncbi:MAG: ABC transporter ATP-binding protein [Aestuariivirga sp.]|uniref:ABC transporter ATP-binding protein n=1 Tax=Aestuariivirga sp. TaxID=2650926 RepID=UPI0025C65BDA|nr:ABC transporter ATP-binding protein [Aestuariivirga sp.]MCA3561180.1 ABC transporter ATP-binding protein [Aestuariivirga sp.]
MSQLAITSLAKSYGALKVFDGLNLEADAGEIVVIFGGSGAGKTILLRLIAGVEEPTAGSIEIGGHDVADIAPEHRGVGMAFQNFALFPHMNASDNIATPLRAAGADESKVAVGVAKVAKLLKIDHVLNHSPRELSNGQKQRTALARALAASPKILLLDDPLRNVDAKLRFEMRLELPRLLRQSGATVLYVTQDYKEAMALADRIAVLANGQFVQTATPEDIYMRPATLGVARLFGDPSINTADTVIETEGGTHVMLGGTRVPLADGYRGFAGREVIFGVRPESVEIGSTGVEAEVIAVTPLNERTVLLLQNPNGWEFLASLPSTASNIPEAGAKVKASFAAAGTHIFDRQTGERLHG